MNEELLLFSGFFSPWRSSWIPGWTVHWWSSARCRIYSPLLLFLGTLFIKNKSYHNSYTTEISHTTTGLSGFTHSLRLCWPLPESRPDSPPWGRGRTRRCPRRPRAAGPVQKVRWTSGQSHKSYSDLAQGWVALTLAMSQTVTSSQVAARSKLCTLFFTLRAILQSPQPKSATTREEGLEDMREHLSCFDSDWWLRFWSFQ